MRAFCITRPDDWHLHCRDDDLLHFIVPASANYFSRALVMPNLKPALTTVNALIAYRDRILHAAGSYRNFTPYMTLYINESMPVDELYLAKQYDFILGAKLYPAGTTTHSEQGVKSIRALYPLFEVMQELDLVLQIHGEVIHGDIFEREAKFINDVLTVLIGDFPKLRIVLEHISTLEAVEFIMQTSNYVAATITPHHLFYNRNHLLAGGIRPHYYCLPVLKHERDQRAILTAAVSGNPHFFAGTDSAPHLRGDKESVCGCAGIFSAPYALAMYTEVFANANQLGRLNGFMSQFGADFYHLSHNVDEIELIKVPQTIPAVLKFPGGEIVPVGAGSTLQWSVNEHA
jgi:dihydroorotase